MYILYISDKKFSPFFLSKIRASEILLFFSVKDIHSYTEEISLIET